MLNFINISQSFFPFIKTIKGYSKEKAKADFLAGLTVAIVASPQSMAYAMIAGVAPVYGLYASILPVIIAALFGSSRFHTAGPTNAVALVAYTSLLQCFIGGVAVGTLPEELRLPFMFMLSILTGIIQLFLGISRLGHLANFISHSVLLAFTTGASLLIVIGQMKNFFGLDFNSSASTIELLHQITLHIKFLNPYTLCTSILTMFFALLLRKLYPKAPYALFSLILISLIAYIFDFQKHGVVMSPQVPFGLPPLFLPNLEHITSIPELFFPALAVALIASVSSIAIGKNLAHVKGDYFNANQELIGQGLGNISAGFSSAIPGGGSFSRSAVNYSANAQTRFAAAFSGVLTLAFLLLAGPFVAYIPVSALSALLLLICLSMIDKNDIRFVMRSSQSECFVFLSTLASVFIFGLERAIFIGVFLSLCLFIKKQSEQSFHLLEKEMIPVEHDHPLFESKNLHIFCFEGPLFFGSVGELEKNLKYIEELENATDAVIILHMNRVNMIDASSAYELQLFLARMAKVNASIIICSSAPQVHIALEKSGVLEQTKTPHVKNMKAAFDIAEKLLEKKMNEE